MNPCGDPPGGTLTPPTSQGGALRAQSFRRPATQAASLDGAILRVNPDTGLAAAGNPAIADADPQPPPDRRLRLPQPVPLHLPARHRRALVGDVGWNTYEEINRTPDVVQGRTTAGRARRARRGMGSYDSLNLGSCETLYSAGAQRRDRAVLRLPPQRPDRRRARAARRAPRRSPASRSTPETRSGTDYKDALFFSDYSAQLHLGDAPGPTACRTRRRGRPSWPARPARSSSPRAPTARSFTPTSRAAVRRIAADNTRRPRASPPTRPPAPRR